MDSTSRDAIGQTRAAMRSQQAEPDPIRSSRRYVAKRALRRAGSVSCPGVPDVSRMRVDGKGGFSRTDLILATCR